MRDRCPVRGRRGYGGRITQHARAMMVAATVPTIASSLLLLMVGPLLPMWSAWALLLCWLAALALSTPPVGERWLPTLIWRARPATASEQHTLTYAIRHACHEVPVPGLRVRITTGNDVRAYGSHTLLLGEGIIASIRARTLPNEHLAGIVGHQLGLLRVGATRGDPMLHTLAWPWHVLALVRIPIVMPLLRSAMMMRPLFVPLLIFLSWTEQDAGYLMGLSVLLLSYLPGAQRSHWMHHRRVLGDELLAGTSLTAPFAEWLLSRDHSPASYERVYALIGAAQPDLVRAPQHAPWW